MSVLQSTDSSSLLLATLVLVLVAVIGLYVVKWNPYLYRSMEAAGSHSLGEPIVGEDAQ